MRKIILILGLVLAPSLVLGSTASDFIVNSQPTYTVPPGTTELLILDLTLPSTGLTSIKINNAGNVAQYDISQLSIYEDGSSPGWDGDESERIRKSLSPFFDVVLNGDFSKQRIFVIVGVNSNTYTGKTIKLEIEINSAVFSNSVFNGPTDKKITGFERMILAGTSIPSVPVSPMAKKGEALSASTIRWYFTDLSNNEFGFKILDSNLKEVVRKEEANISYLDEINLQPDTEYSGRRIVAFNDRGESLSTVLTVFPAVRTLPLPPDLTSEVNASTSEVDVLVVELTPEEELRVKIQELQQKIIDLLKQLILLLQEQISAAQASLFGAFGIFTNWLEARFQ